MIVFTDLLRRTNNKYPIADSSEIRGGMWSVDNVDELTDIPSLKLQEGMFAYIKNLDIYYTYKYTGWLKAEFNSSGVPIYTEKRFESLPTKPTDYILIRDNDLSKPIENKTYHTSFDGTYMDVLFSAIRSLLSEVAKLKNSFKYGITSYTETATAMSTNMGNLQDPDEEPLWAVEEESLSELTSCTVVTDYTHSLQGSDIKADNENEILTITGDAVFLDPSDGFKALRDPKSLVYLTSSALNITIHLTSTSQSSIDIPLNSLISNSANLYNILIIVSKKSTKNLLDPVLYGKNFVWILITDALTNSILCLGYYNGVKLISNVYELSTEYYINSISFRDLQLSKFNSYTKSLDFSYEVIPSQPQEDKYKFSTAHLTIRSVSTLKVLEYLTNLLLENELIWVEELRLLCIKSKGKIFTIGGTSINDDTTMTTEELIASLRNLGISINGSDGDYDIELSNLTGITFIHEDTQKAFEINVDSNGNLRSSLIDTNYLSDRVNKVKIDDISAFRGFISKLRLSEKALIDPTVSYTSDAGLLSDRLKIGAIYAPKKGRNVFGCSHAYVELENTSDQDINLKGCYLHVLYKELANIIESLPLTGVIKAGSTYLIRGKLYAEFTDVNTVIKVDSFDQEWFVNKELIDFQRDELSFIMLYNDSLINAETEYFNPSKNIIYKYFIDAACVRGNGLGKWMADGSFNITDSTTTRDYILKNTFELDPAKQAFQSMNTIDSSRVRGANKNDFKPFYIDIEHIAFPNSDPIYDVSLITPKASYLNKNVSTDKTKLDLNRPNMLYCSFGIDMHKTRCFNWISAGQFDEYLWVRKKGTDDWYKFLSYTTITSTISLADSTIYRKEFSVNINNSVYARMTGRFPGDGTFYTSHKCIIEFKSYPDVVTTYEYCVGRQLLDGSFDPQHVSNIQTFTLYPLGSSANVYHITDLQGFYWIEYLTWAASAKVLANKISNDVLNNSIFPVIINTGDVTQNGTRINEWLDYYLAGYDLFKLYEHMSVVGNNDLCGTDPSILGTGDDVGKSNSYYHHLFNCYEIDTEDLIVNSKYVPSVYYFLYLNSDKSINVRFINVNSEITFINCRDWFGLSTNNKDVAYNIYTGWTVGNAEQLQTSEYLNGLFTPIYNTLYTWLSGVKSIVSCHEIPFTVMTALNLKLSVKAGELYNEGSRSIDGKVGGALVGSHLNQLTKFDNTCLYWFSRLLEHSGVKLVLGGHKHTYTCTYPVREFYFYQDILEDGTRDSIIKNSLEHGPMLMREDLSKEFSSEGHLVKWEYIPSNPNVSLTFTTDANFSGKGYVFFNNTKTFHTSRLPLVKYSGKLKRISDDGKTELDYSSAELESLYLPIVSYPEMENGVTYFMCLATGYKQTSNKELPGTSQAFTMLLPKTTYNSDTKKYTASSDLQRPMFAIVKLRNGNADLHLYRILDILEGKVPLYNNSGEYSSKPPYLLTISAESSRFGDWKGTYFDFTDLSLVNISL